MSCILVTDAEEHLVGLIARCLSARGHQVLSTHSASEAIRSTQNMVIDLMILDVLTCAREGIEACRALETHAMLHHIPVLFLTYPDEERHAQAPLFNVEEGNYLARPFDIEELDGRVAALLKGSMQAPPMTPEDVLRVGPLSLDPRTFKVNAGGESVLLTPREFDLLRYLIEHAGEVVSSETLLQDAWKTPAYAEGPEVVRWHIRNLRSKIDRSAGRSIQIIQTVTRHGYIIPEEISDG